MLKILTKAGCKNRTLAIFQQYPTYIDLLPDVFQDDVVALTLLRRRLDKQSFASIAEEQGYTKQAIQYRERKALETFISYIFSLSV